MHDFWRNEDLKERQENMMNFMKNAALAGGALALEPKSLGKPASQSAVVRSGKKLRKIARTVAA